MGSKSCQKRFLRLCKKIHFMKRVEIASNRYRIFEKLCYYDDSTDNSSLISAFLLIVCRFVSMKGYRSLYGV